MTDILHFSHNLSHPHDDHLKNLIKRKTIFIAGIIITDSQSMGVSRSARAANMCRVSCVSIRLSVGILSSVVLNN